MNILVIGNGFDLAHGLKTGYKDFLLYAIQRDKALYNNFFHEIKHVNQNNFQNHNFLKTSS